MRDIVIYAAFLAALCVACVHDLGIEVSAPGPVAAEAAGPVARRGGLAMREAASSQSRVEACGFVPSAAYGREQGGGLGEADRSGAHGEPGLETLAASEGCEIQSHPAR